MRRKVERENNKIDVTQVDSSESEQLYSLFSSCARIFSFSQVLWFPCTWCINYVRASNTKRPEGRKVRSKHSYTSWEKKPFRSLFYFLLCFNCIHYYYYYYYWYLPIEVTLTMNSDHWSKYIVVVVRVINARVRQSCIYMCVL